MKKFFPNIQTSWPIIVLECQVNEIEFLNYFSAFHECHNKLEFHINRHRPVWKFLYNCNTFLKVNSERYCFKIVNSYRLKENEIQLSHSSRFLYSKIKRGIYKETSFILRNEWVFSTLLKMSFFIHFKYYYSNKKLCESNSDSTTNFLEV